MTGRIRTYARRRVRAHPVRETASSPLREIDREDISLAEMSRRMLKRARQADDHAGTDDAHDQKRIRHSNTDKEKTMLIGYDPTDPLSYQTPAPPSPASPKPPATDRLSPLPVVRRTISRHTSSRNLKENRNIPSLFGTSSRSRPVLASPFHSRPGSASSSPNKAQFERKIRKSRALSDSKPRPIDEPTHTIKHSTHNTPHTRTRTMHNENLAGLDIQNIPVQNWFIPPKVLSSSHSKLPLVGISPYIYDTSPTESQYGTAAFFSGVTHSTPHTYARNLDLPHGSTMYAPKTEGENNFEVEDAFEMEERRNRRQLPSRVALAATSVNRLFPATATRPSSAGSLPFKEHHFLDHVSKTASSRRARQKHRHEQSHSLAQANLSDMFDNLDLESTGIQTDLRDSQHSFPTRTRSLGSSAPIQRQVRHRASTIKASDFAHSGLPRRTRSGTITQKEFSFEGVALPEPSSDLDLCPLGHNGRGKAPTRTRSGTIIQRKISLSKSGIRLSAEENNDMIGIEENTKIPTEARSEPSKRVRSVELPDDTESDDELLLTGPWPDEDWVLCARPGERLEAIADPDESDDELNLFNAGDPW